MTNKTEPQIKHPVRQVVKQYLLYTFVVFLIVSGINLLMEFDLLPPSTTQWYIDNMKFWFFVGPALHLTYSLGIGLFFYLLFSAFFIVLHINLFVVRRRTNLKLVIISIYWCLCGCAAVWAAATPD